MEKRGGLYSPLPPLVVFGKHLLSNTEQTGAEYPASVTVLTQSETSIRRLTGRQQCLLAAAFILPPRILEISIDKAEESSSFPPNQLD